MEVRSRARLQDELFPLPLLFIFWLRRGWTASLRSRHDHRVYRTTSAVLHYSFPTKINTHKILFVAKVKQYFSEHIGVDCPL